MPRNDGEPEYERAALTPERLMEQNAMLKQTVMTLESERARAEDRLQNVPPLLDEIDRLRSTIASLEVQNHALERRAAGLRDELDQRAIEQERLQRQVDNALRTSQRLMSQYTESEKQNNSLAHLYVTSARLHGSCNRDSVLRAIEDVVAHFIGGEGIAVFELDEDEQYLKLAASTGVDRELYRRVPVGRGYIGNAVLAGEPCLAARSAAEPDLENRDVPVAVVPLKLEGRLSGAIVVFRLISDKKALGPADDELFTLLATHAATALYCSRLHERSRSERSVSR